MNVVAKVYDHDCDILLSLQPQNIQWLISIFNQMNTVSISYVVKTQPFSVLITILLVIIIIIIIIICTTITLIIFLQFFDIGLTSNPYDLLMWCPKILPYSPNLTWSNLRK